MDSSELFLALLKRAFSEDNNEAFDALYYYLLRYLSLLRLEVTLEDLQDAVIETIEKAWINLETGKLLTHPNPERWVRRVAYTTAVNYWRVQSKNNKFLRMDDIVVDNNKSKSSAIISEESISVSNIDELPEQALEHLEIKYFILHALSLVSSVNRPFLIASMVYETEVEELAKQSGCSVRTVQRRIAAGKNEFKQVYKALISVPSHIR